MNGTRVANAGESNAGESNAILESLREIARRYGTPAYAFDVRRLRSQAAMLQDALPRDIEVFYSLKANASLGICDVLADCGLGADVASAGELATAIEAGFPASRMFVAGPSKSAETIEMLRSIPDAIISVDSPSELARLRREELPNPMVLRLRPDYESCAIVAAGVGSRFGVAAEGLAECRRILDQGQINLIGFHVFAGSQVLEADGVIDHLHKAVDLSSVAADELGIRPEFLNLGGGFGIPYAANDDELDLAEVAAALEELRQKLAPIRLALELGRYFVAQAGWYLTSVLDTQTHACRKALVVDGGTHQRADMCGLNLRTNARPPLVLNATDSTVRQTANAVQTTPTDILGCLSLPADVMSEAAELPSKVGPGDVLAYPNAGAYGLWSSPAVFHAYPLPTEVAFDESEIMLMRRPKPASSILDGQLHVLPQHASANAM